jgi:asparagine N-glycosylation enzyme membrane subunit Stt3
MEEEKQIEQSEKKTDEKNLVVDELEERKKKFLTLVKKKKEWVFYLVLAFITYIAVYIRTLNIPKLKDVTTGTWTLGPDLDPFLFLRWAKYIVVNGGLMAVDTLRYSPIGFNTSAELKLLSYLMAGFHKFLLFFNKETTVTYSAILFPVFMFALTAIAFFLFTRKIFYKETSTTRNIIGLLATLLFVLVPSLLPRTIAGIPEKESAAFFFMFISLYFFLEAFTSEKKKKGLIFGVLSGISTGLMALVWGAYIFIFFAISIIILVGFVFGKVRERELNIYFLWLISSFIVMIPNFKPGIIGGLFSSSRYTFSNLIGSTSTGLAIGIFGIILSGILIARIKNEKLKDIKKKTKLPDEIFYLILSLLLIIILSFIVFGPEFFTHKIQDVKDSLISPQTSRLGMTVAENKQPYFIDDWKGSFGPIYLNLPLFFWMFFIGSVALFYNLIKKFEKKEKIVLTLSYLVFLICLVFSRYSPNSILNGTSGFSILIYFGGAILFIGTFFFYYYQNHKRGEHHLFADLNFAYLLYFLILTLAIIGARGAIRLIMMLAAVSPIAIAFLVVKTTQKVKEEKDETKRFLFGILALILIISTILTISAYYREEKYSAENYAPGPYQWQWQKAMNWVRQNTSENAVFAHWWDYGYWLQSLGERTTVLDGSNSIVYWNYMMGRHVLTGTDEKTTIDFLYAHNTTHLLIDSTEIGKYTAFSSIGSDENYDRFSWITTFLMDERQTQETSNETVYVYLGWAATDEDINWKGPDGEIFLPKKKAGIGAVFIRKDKEKFLQSEGVFIYNGNQYKIPLRYAYIDGKLNDFGSGLDAGIFVFPRIDADSSGGIRPNEFGALMYLSQRTVHSNLANLYLFDKPSTYFNLTHTESSYIVDVLKGQGLYLGEFLYYNGVQGPIKIWEIKYPNNIQLNSSYLEKNFPNEDLFLAKPGEY